MGEKLLFLLMGKLNATLHEMLLMFEALCSVKKFVKLYFVNT